MSEFSRPRGNEGYGACSDDATPWGHHLSPRYKTSMRPNRKESLYENRIDDRWK